MSIFNIWCMDCEIRKHYWENYNRLLDWKDCPYVCEYAIAIRNLAKGDEQ